MTHRRKPHSKSRSALASRIKWSVIGLLVGLFIGYLSGYVPPPSLSPRPLEVWKFIEAKAPQYHLDPHFVYAIAMAESSLRPNAYTRVARGMMQLSRASWQNVSHEPYRQAWNWRKNVTVGMKYLRYCRHFLEQHNAFSYANLAAAYHHGPRGLKKRGFNAQAFLSQEHNKIYEALLRGEQAPVPAPEDDE